MKGLFPPFQRQRDRAPSLTRPFSGRYQLFPRFLSRLRFVLWQTKPRADVSEALQVAPVSSRNRRGRRPGSAASGRYQLFPPFPPQAPFCSLPDDTAHGRFGGPASIAGSMPKPLRKAARQRRIRPDPPGLRFFPPAIRLPRAWPGRDQLAVHRRTASGCRVFTSAAAISICRVLPACIARLYYIIWS